MRIASGIEKPDAGHGGDRGHDLWTDEVAARRMLAYIPEHPDLTPYATVGEIAALVARLRGAPGAAAREALATAGLERLGRRTVRELSLGQRRRAVVAAAMIGAPSVLLLDEPLEALDAEMRAHFLGWVDSALARGATALVATHETAPWMERCVRSIRLANGRVTSG
jgi:ABC-type multidrug transport system ATPase subunit